MERVDVVVVGAGTAGLPAAIEAADAGARVMLIDKQPEIGGMLHISTGQFSGAGTRRQHARGIDDSPAAHLADVERLSHGRANRELVELAVSQQGEAVDWLDDLGFEFADDTPRLVPGHELYSVPRTLRGSRSRPCRVRNTVDPTRADPTRWSSETVGPRQHRQAMDT
jgi:fumarate reductase flavoprotein subunit